MVRAYRPLEDPARCTPSANSRLEWAFEDCVLTKLLGSHGSCVLSSETW